MATIDVGLNVQVSDGPQAIAKKSIDVEVYDRFEICIGNDPKTKQTIEAPAAFDLGKNVSFLLIRSNLDEPAGTDKPKVTYKVGGKEVTLDAPHVYLGRGGVSVLGDNLSVTFTFTPGDAPKDFVKIEILVGRDV
jgi:hypothetical protein